MVKKRQKDLFFWKNKVKILEQKYQKLNTKQG